MDNNNDTNNELKNEIKNETTEAISQAKEVFKNVDIQQEAEKTKGFFVDMLNDPIGKIKSIGNSGVSLLPLAIAIFVVWTAAVFFRSALSALTLTWRFANLIPRLVNIITSTVSPAFIILVLSASVYIVYKDKIKQFLPLIITITIASAPRAIAAVLSIFITLIPTSNMVIASINGFLSLISIILVYFGIKALVNEDSDEVFFKSFVKIQCIYFVARIVLQAFGIMI